MDDLYLTFSDDKMKKSILEDINTNEESLKKDTESLMEWMEKQPHLPNVKDEELISNALIRCKNSMEMTKRRLNAYYTCRAVMNDIFTNRDPDSKEFAHAMKYVCITPLPKITPDGYRIVVYALGKDTDTNFPNCENVLKALQMQLDLSLKLDVMKGAIIICDFGNTSVAFVAFLMTLLKRYMALLKSTFSIRYHKIYILNSMTGVEAVLNIVKGFMKKELANRIQIWNKQPEELVEVLPKNILSSTYGGFEKPIDELQKEWREYLKQFRDWYKAEEHIKADLTKIPTGASNNKEIMAYDMEGSFRKINLD